MSDAQELIGQRIAEKYVVERVIGRGGMGAVVRAHHDELRTPVAIKVLQLGGVDNQEAVKRFLREARAAAQIRSDHVAHVYDVGKLPSGEPYMVMEYLEGCDLAEELSHRSELPIAEAVDITLQAMEAVAHAHAVGIIHRDLKPANLYLARQGGGGRLVKVLDFGISKIIEDGDPAITESASVLGSPLYMAPEQIRNASTVDERADVWSLGVILYECLAGALPFSGVTSSAVLATIVADQHIPLEERCTDIPLELSEIVESCLAKDPEDRIGGLAELSARLAVFATADGRRFPAKIASILGLTPNHWSPLGPSGGRIGFEASAPVRKPTPAPSLNTKKTLSTGSRETTDRIGTAEESAPTSRSVAPITPTSDHTPGSTTAISPRYSDTGTLIVAEEPKGKPKSYLFVGVLAAVLVGTIWGAMSSAPSGPKQKDRLSASPLGAAESSERKAQKHPEPFSKQAQSSKKRDDFPDDSNKAETTTAPKTVDHLPRARTPAKALTSPKPSPAPTSPSAPGSLSAPGSPSAPTSPGTPTSSSVPTPTRSATPEGAPTTAKAPAPAPKPLPEETPPPPSDPLEGRH